jgi:hypothetical protein
MVDPLGGPALNSQWVCEPSRKEAKWKDEHPVEKGEQDSRLVSSHGVSDSFPIVPGSLQHIGVLEQSVNERRDRRALRQHDKSPDQEKGD